MSIAAVYLTNMAAPGILHAEEALAKQPPTVLNRYSPGEFRVLSDLFAFSGTGSYPPYLVSYEPVYASVPTVTPVLALSFDKDIQLGKGFIRIFASSDDSLAALVAVSGGTMTGATYQFSGSTGIRIVPQQALADNSEYYVQVTPGTFADLNGNDFSGVAGEIWTFHISDLTAPEATFVPDDGAESDVKLMLQTHFNEPVRWGTGSIIIRDAATDEAVQSVTVTSGVVTPGAYSYLQYDNRQFYVQLPKLLLSGTAYYVDVAPGTFMDYAGNAYAGVAGANGWDFRTIDRAPWLLDFGADASGSTPEMYMIFSETVALGTGYIQIFRSSDHSLAELVAVSGGAMAGATYQFSGTDGLRIALQQTMADGDKYYVQITSGTFRDLTGTNFLGYRDKDWRFQTIDLTGPEATFVPDDGAESDVQPMLQIHFNEPVRWGTGSIIIRDAATDEAVQSVTVTSGVVTPGVYSYWQNGNQQINVQLPGALESGTAYYIDVAPGTFMDYAGNAYAGVAGPSGWDFRTIDRYPSLLDFDADANLSPELRLHFSEAIALGTGFIKIFDQHDDSLAALIAVSGGTMAGATYQFSGSDVVRIAVQQVLKDDNEFYVQITPGTFRDLTDNSFSGIQGTYLTFRTPESNSSNLQSGGESSSNSNTPLIPELQDLSEPQDLPELQSLPEPAFEPQIEAALAFSDPDVIVSVHVEPIKATASHISLPVETFSENALVYYYHEKFNKWIAVPTQQTNGTVTAAVPPEAWVSVMDVSEVKQPPDTVQSWANADILKLVSLGIVSGFENGDFRPQEESDRYQVAAMLTRALNPDLSSVDMSVLDNLPDGDKIPEWAKPAVAYMVAQGIMVGTDSGFDGDFSMTRAQLAAIIGRMLPADGEIQAAEYSDGNDMPEWAQDGINMVTQLGIMQGFPDGSFGPDLPVTREQLASVLSRLIEIL